MPFTTWDNTCPWLGCRQPVPAELSGLEPDGLTLTCPHCRRPAVLRVLDRFKAAQLMLPPGTPPPGYADTIREMFNGVIPDDWPRRPGDGLPPPGQV